MASKDQEQTAGGAEALIAGCYAIDPARPLAGAGGGLPAFAVRDGGADAPGLMAIQVRPDAPARAPVVSGLASKPPPGLLAPRAVGPSALADGRVAQFVVGTAPPGPSLAATLTRPWSDAEVMEQVVRPVAAALDALQARHLTHREIRPDNLFRHGPGGHAVLGSFWAAPPASRQHALFEPPYSAMCPPCGRGAGSIADDVYALGVTLLVLALGRTPLDGIDEAAVVRRKLEQGSFQALAGEERLAPALSDLVRGMLAEDPEHRPPPAMLLDPSAARARRVAARPPGRSQRPLELGTRHVWDARTLAHALASDPDQGARLLRGGVIEQWLRRGVGDVALASHLDELGRTPVETGAASGRSDALLVMRAVAALDPLAPLCWRGLAFWPDALGPLLAAATVGGGDPRVEEIVLGEVIGAWAEERPERCDPVGLRVEGRQHRAAWRISGWSGGEARLRYALNPLLPCASPLLQGHVVTRNPEILPALEARAGRDKPRGAPIDLEMSAFIAARHEGRAEGDVAGLGRASEPDEAALTVLRVLSNLQARFSAQQSFPRLAAWVGQHVAPLVDTWRNRPRRHDISRRLEDLVAAGQLPAIRSLLDNPAIREADEHGAELAEAAVRAIDAELARIAAQAPARARHAQAAGTDLAATVAAMALVGAVVAALLG